MNLKMAICLTAAVLFIGIPAGVGVAHAQITATASQSQQAQPQNRTFTGEVTRDSDNRNELTPFIIYDQTTKMNYFLEGNNHEISRYDDDNVQISGTLNRSGDTIHVQSIHKLHSDEPVPFSAAGK